MKVVARENKVAVRGVDLKANPLGIRAKAQIKVDSNGVEWYILPRTSEVEGALIRAGFSLPPKIISDYRWPGMFKPMRHQILTVAAMTKHKRLFVLNGMGTGKSMASLWAVDHGINRQTIKRTLIVAPISTLQDVWGDSIFANFLNRSYVVLKGSKERRLKLFNQNHDYYIINPEGLHIIVDELKSRPDISHVIIDELALYRASKNRINLMNSILNTGGVVRTCWGLTGEPTPNAPTDAYWQVKLLRPDLSREIGSFTSFRDKLMWKRGLFNYIPRDGAMETVFRFMQPAVRFALADCADIPEQTFQFRQVELPPEQKKVYDRMLKESYAEFEDSEIEAVNAGVRYTKLLQIACGAVYDGEGNTVVLGIDERMKVVRELIESSDRKVIVMIPFTSVLDLVYNNLVANKIGTVKMDGRNKADREEIFDSFRRSKTVKVLVANPRVLSHGITLTEADTTIWFSPITSNDVYTQANARTHRLSQEHKTSVINIYATRTEKDLYDGLKEKKRLQDVLLELVKRNTKENI